MVKRKDILSGVSERLCGSEKDVEERIGQAFSEREKRAYISKLRKRNQFLYGTLLFLLILLIFSWGIDSLRQGDIREIARPEPGEGAKTVDLKAIMNYKGSTLARDVKIRLRERALSVEEEFAILEEVSESIEKNILGRNTSLAAVVEDLNLWEKAADGIVAISWDSDRPDLIAKDGKVRAYDAIKEEKVNLTAVLRLGDRELVKGFQVMVIPANEQWDKMLEEKLGAVVDHIDGGVDDTQDTAIPLPDMIDEVIETRWKTKGDVSYGFLCSLVVLMAVAVYFKRYDYLEKAVKRRKEMIQKELPDFIHKMVLLLNAGLVASAAFYKIMADYEKNRTGSPLFEELLLIRQKAEETNMPFAPQIMDFARRSGIQEFMRAAAIISDNVDKGSSLADKLSASSEFLWMNRKKKAEEQGRLAETKLTIPLMLLLLALLLIAVSPAMMEMQI